MISPVATELSPAQRAIVDAPRDQPLLVLAAAGTGKTQVLVERIRRLVREEELAPGRDLLVLSFTRTAVAELRRRIGSTGGRAAFVRPVTFDSFATALLASTPASPPNWRELGYDRRIAAATGVLATEPDIPLVERYRQVFVDEIQDLVGVRARLVATILESVEGFTLLGDPAQAIYDHQVRDAADATTSAEFLEEIRRRYPSLRTLTLDENYRSKNVESAAVERVGAELRGRDPQRPVVALALAAIYRELEPLGAFEDLASALRGARRRIAVLCRSNIEALRISKHLYEQNVEHRLQREATDRVLPDWLATLFEGSERSRWARRRLEAVAEDRLGGDDPDAETVWRLLSETVADDEVIELDSLRRRISWGMVSDELVAAPPANVTVSTVHRAKGLEFDLVFLPSPRRDIEDEDDPEELRIMYVALSRAREELWTFPPPCAEPWDRDHAIGGRLVRSNWRARWQTTAIELRPHDLDAARPFGIGLIETNAVEAQQYLREQVRAGDAIDLRLVQVRDSDEGEIPAFEAVHGQRRVGESSEELGRALSRRLRASSGSARWPERLVGARCDGVETVIGMTSQSEVAGLGSSGMWLRPRLVGLADLYWDDREGERP